MGSRQQSNCPIKKSKDLFPFCAVARVRLAFANRAVGVYLRDVDMRGATNFINNVERFYAIRATKCVVSAVIRMNEYARAVVHYTMHVAVIHY